MCYTPERFNEVFIILSLELAFPHVGILIAVVILNN